MLFAFFNSLVNNRVHQDVDWYLDRLYQLVSRLIINFVYFLSAYYAYYIINNIRHFETAYERTTSNGRLSSELFSISHSLEWSYWLFLMKTNPVFETTLMPILLNCHLVKFDSRLQNIDKTTSFQIVFLWSNSSFLIVETYCSLEKYQF